MYSIQTVQLSQRTSTHRLSAMRDEYKQRADSVDIKKIEHEKSRVEDVTFSKNSARALVNSTHAPIA